MKMHAMVFVLLATLSATSWAADEQRGWVMLVPLGQGEGYELTALWKANRSGSDIGDEEGMVADPCESVKLAVTFSEPRDLVASRTENVVLSSDEPLAQFSAGFNEFGSALLIHYRVLEQRGACDVLRGARVTNAEGDTAAYIGFNPILPQKTGSFGEVLDPER